MRARATVNPKPTSRPNQLLVTGRRPCTSSFFSFCFGMDLVPRIWPQESVPGVIQCDAGTADPPLPFRPVWGRAREMFPWSRIKCDVVGAKVGAETTDLTDRRRDRLALAREPQTQIVKNCCAFSFPRGDVDLARLG